MYGFTASRLIRASCYVIGLTSSYTSPVNDDNDLDVPTAAADTMLGALNWLLGNEISSRKKLDLFVQLNESRFISEFIDNK